MTSRLNPYISFPGTAREAMEFYKDVFGGELNVSTFGEFGGETPNPDVSLSGDEGDELRGYWDKLSAGGNVTMPLEKQMWGDEFGMCVDRFGVSWMVNVSQPAA